MDLKKDVRVVCKTQTEYGEYCDALYYPSDKVPTDKVIETEMQGRVNNWVEMVKNPPEPIEPTAEELEKMIADLEAQKVNLQTQLDNKRK